VLMFWVFGRANNTVVFAHPNGHCGATPNVGTNNCQGTPPDCPDDQSNACDGYCSCWNSWYDAHCNGYVGLLCYFEEATEGEHCDDAWDCAEGLCCGSEDFCEDESSEWCRIVN
jgi:hypothetical protein